MSQTTLRMIPCRNVGELKQLRIMDGGKTLHAFDFDNHGIVDDNIYAVSPIEVSALIFARSDRDIGAQD